MWWCACMAMYTDVLCVMLVGSLGAPQLHNQVPAHRE